ncbi:hypothetical protein [Neorhizobium sp. P12A]|uniref:hypothetical protein n=1 Tax=Neorhizobium sp. P12A TaxID=2268027 RepID=UPI0011EC317D|nr:hypothetical protein [Neorhizobium sp. P12A]
MNLLIHSPLTAGSFTGFSILKERTRIALHHPNSWAWLRIALAGVSTCRLMVAALQIGKTSIPVCRTSVETIVATNLPLKYSTTGAT